MKALLISVWIMLSGLTAGGQDLPEVVSGKIERIAGFHSDFVEARNIDVWLPEDYNPASKYDVLYMHDGQMLYDASTTWNKSSWDVDDILSELNRQRRIRKVIVVGIWNGGERRHSEYFPQKPFESLSEEEKAKVFKATRANGSNVLSDYKINSDLYLKFIVEELKPLIDRTYSVHTKRDHTFIAGSSMGGLISLYATCEYPGIFGGAICMSTHWPGIFSMDGNPIPDAFIRYMRKNLPDPETHKIYFDYGDQTLDALYPPLQKKVDELMGSKGFTSNNWKTQFFPGMDHSEKAWNQRFHIPMEFMLNTKL